jgi:hypothetical protein
VTLLCSAITSERAVYQERPLRRGEVQLKAADRQSEALERTDAALEASRPSHFAGSEVKKLNGGLRKSGKCENVRAAPSRIQKIKGPASSAGPFSALYSTYPLVTTGGGALPLPTYCAQPAMLRRANIATVAIASFFITLSSS